MLYGLLAGEEQAEHIHVEVFVELFLGHLFQRREFVNAGVIDQDVDLAERLFRGGEETFDFRFVSDVGADSDCLAAVFRDFVFRGFVYQELK